MASRLWSPRLEKDISLAFVRGELFIQKLAVTIKSMKRHIG